MPVDWDSVVLKLDSVFRSDKESFARVLFYLGEEENLYKETEQDGPALKILNSAMTMYPLFSKYAQRLAEDTKRADSDARFKRNLGFIYSQMLALDKPCTDVEILPAVPFSAALEEMGAAAFPGLLRALTKVPVESRKEFLAMLAHVFPPTTISTLDGVVSALSKVESSVVMVALATVTLAYEVVKNIERWWNGEITGKRCCKNVIDSFSGVAGAVGGGCAGVAVGGLVGGPIGMVVGGAVGSVISGEAAKRLSEWLTEKIFDLPKSEALENAYNYFSLERNASNHAINTAYRQKCLEHHPDKGGSSEEFHKVQVNLSIIKASKGELYS